MNESNILHYPDDYLTKVGSTSIHDAIFLFILPPISILSLIGNILSYRIFSDRYFQKKPLYTYLRVCCLNSSLICLVYAITFICDSRRYVYVSNTQFATYFRCFVKIPITNTCYFYGCMLDIVVAFDRMVEFTRFKRRFRQLNPYMICAVICAICLGINAPYLLVFEPKQEVVIVRNNGSSSPINQVFYYYGESEFALSHQGRIFKNIQYFIRDILTLFVLVIINVATLILLRMKYRVKKLNAFESTNSKEKSNDENLYPQTLLSKSALSNDSQNIMVSSNPNNPEFNRRSSIECIQETMNRNNLYMSVSQVNIMLTKMVLIICIISALEHIFLTMSLQMFTDSSSSLRLHMVFLFNVFLLLKHSINVFIFYYFNAFFKNRFNRLIFKS